MSRFHKFVDEKCMGAYTSDADKKKKKKKKMDEYGLNEKTSNIDDVADNMARLIMGSKDDAINSLKKSLPLTQATFEPGEEYNKAFIELRKNIMMAIKKSLKAAK